MDKATIEQLVNNAAREVVAELSAELTDGLAVVLDRPRDYAHGDWSTNVALRLAGTVKRNPVEIAQMIAEKLNETAGGFTAEGVAPGYVNITMNNDYRRSVVTDVLSKKETYGQRGSHKDQRTIVEYTDPNPFKVFHIGHLMTNTIGESVARLYEHAGAIVARANYQGDVGMHVAKTMWGILQKKDDFPGDDMQLEKRIAFLGECYVAGNNAFEDSDEANAQIRELNKKIYEKSDDELNELYTAGREWSLAHFEELYKILGTKFDFYFFESEVASHAVKLVQEQKDNGVFQDSEGAVVFPGEKYGLHTRVFLNKEGLPTYEAKDLALPFEKKSRWEYDRSIICTASEITEYFKVILCALEKIDQELAQKTTHIGHGFMRRPDGKMSSRKGNIITGESLIEEAVALAKEKVVEAGFIEEAKQDETAEYIGVAAVKYAILRYTVGRDIVYDPEKAISFDGDSGPYLQYTCVRARSVVAKAKELGIEPNAAQDNAELSGLEQQLERFGEVAEKSLAEHSPHHVCVYLSSLAQAFNTYYAQNRIADADNDQAPYRAAVTLSVATVLANGLHLLGIKVPEKM